MKVDVEKTKEFITKRNLTQQQVAKSLGVSKDYAWRLINGRGRQSNPKYETIEKLADVLGVKVSTITVKEG